jgi:dynein heavy chain
MMFEVQDLKVASPATVSRCGMVFMEQIHVGALSLAQTWSTLHLSKHMPEHCKFVVGLIEKYFHSTLLFIRDNCHEKMASMDCNLMSSLLNLLLCILASEEVLDALKSGGHELAHVRSLLSKEFAFALTWSLGANIDDASRPKFSAFLHSDVFPSLLGDGQTPGDDVYSFLVDVKTMTWTTWEALTPEFHYDMDKAYFSLLVPTSDTTRYKYLLDKLLKLSFPVLFMGETGVGKSVIVQAYLDEMAATPNFTAYTVGYSAQTKPVNLRDVFETKLDKKKKTLLGPPVGKKLLLFVDDLNMPSLEVYGAQPPNELLRQVIDQQGFYDTHKLFFKNIKDVVYVSACAPPGGGRNEVSPRLIRHFNMVWLPQLSAASMVKIFTNILSGFISCCQPDLVDLCAKLVTASVTIYTSVQKLLLPTPGKSHYTFNLRDLSKVFQGVLMIHFPADGTLVSCEGLTEIWIHEELRVFRDRLISKEDREVFNELCQNAVFENLAFDWPISKFSDVIYGDYMNREDKKYVHITDMKQLEMLLLEYLEEYNITFPAQMHLVFFTDAIHHISRICRVLRQPRGNALLVGVGGSGRQSLTRLATFITDFQCISIEITRGYGVAEWQEDLKNVLMTAGAHNKKVTFLFTGE